MRVFFINDSTSNPNWGDRAAATALKVMIAEAGHEITGTITENELRDGVFWRGAEPEVAVTEPEGVRRWAELLLPPATFKLRARFAARLAPPAPVLVPRTFSAFDARLREIQEQPRQNARLLEHLNRCDVVVIHGDGCMVGGNLLGHTELFLAYFAKQALAKPVILVNHTGDFEHPDLGEIARQVYPLLDDVRFRETVSQERCRDFTSGVYCPDSAFYFVPAERDAWLEIASRPGYFDVWPDLAAFDPRAPYVCVGGSSIYSFGGKPVAVIDDFVALVGHLVQEYAGQVVLTASDLKDELVFREVADALGLPLLGLSTPVQQAVDVLGHAEAYIGGRWHPSIFALSGGTPVIPISSKTFKIQALARMAGVPSPTFEAHGLSAQKQEIAAALQESLRQGAPLRARLRDWARTQHEQCRQNVAFLDRASGASASPARA